MKEFCYIGFVAHIFWIDSALQFCGKVLNYIDVGGESSALVCAGGSDGMLRIWDPRRPGSSV